MNMVLTRNWWAVALRGVLAVVVGLVALFAPRVFLTSAVLLFGAYAFVDGVFALVAGIRAATRHERWWPFILEGLASVIAGVIAFAIPAVAALALLYLVSAWAILTGIIRISAAIRLRKEIKGEWLLILNGILSVIFGVIIVLFPGAGILTLVWLMGVYAIIFGVVLVALGFRLRGHRATATARRVGIR